MTSVTATGAVHLPDRHRPDRAAVAVKRFPADRAGPQVPHPHRAIVIAGDEPLEGRLAGLDRQRLRAAMGAEAFEAEYAVGRALDLARVLAALGREDAAAGQARVAVSGEVVTALTPRELDVLKLVAQGLSNPDIARRLV